MSILLEDILIELISAGFYEELGKDAFWDKLPDQPDSCIAAIEYMGYPDKPYETDAVHRSVQILCREPSASLAKASVTRVYNYILSSLDETGRIDFNDRFTQTSLRQTPFKVDEDGKARVTYSFNMGITTSIDL